MAMKSYPFPGQATGYDENGFPTSDRDYTEEDLIRMVADLWLNGVVERNYQPLMVTSSGGMDVRVNYGSIFINGRYGYMDPEEDPDYLTLDPGDAEPRIDLISMRLDLSTEVRAITPVIIRGTPSANPIMPEITRDKVIYDMILAKVYVPADAYNITQDNVTDTRKDRDLCGMTHWLVDQVDLETIHSQYNFILEEQLATFNAWIKKRETELDIWFTQNAAAFDEWFTYVKDNLSDDAAYNLLQKTDALEESLNAVKQAVDEASITPTDIVAGIAGETIKAGNLCEINISTSAKTLPNPTTPLTGSGYGISFVEYNGKLYMFVFDGNTKLAIFVRSGTNWDSFPIPSDMATGSLGSISLAVCDNKLYMAYSNNSGTPYIHVYVLSDTTWSKLSIPSGYPSNSVRGVSLAVYNNKLYMAASAATYCHTHVLSGTTWQSLKTFTHTYDVYGVSLAVYDNKLYLAYSYSSTPRIYTYVLSGTTWDQINYDITEISFSLYAGIALAVYNNRLYLGVLHNTTTNRPYSKVFVLNGAKWVLLPDVAATHESQLSKNYGCISLAVYNGRLCMATSHQATPYVYIHAWNGVTWSYLSDIPVLPTGAGYEVSLAVYDNKLYVAVVHANAPRVSSWVFESKINLVTSITTAAEIGRALNDAAIGENVNVEIWTKGNAL